MAFSDTDRKIDECYNFPTQDEEEHIVEEWAESIFRNKIRVGVIQKLDLSGYNLGEFNKKKTFTTISSLNKTKLFLLNKKFF